MSNENKILEAIIRNFKKEYNLSNKNLFNIFSTYEICKDKGISVEDAMESCIDGGGDGGLDDILVFIDGIYIKTVGDYREIINSVNENSTLEIRILQNKETTGFASDVFMKIMNTFENIFDDKIKEENLKTLYNEELIEQIILIRNIYEDIIKFSSNKIYINVYYTTKSNKIDISSQVKDSEIKLVNFLNNSLCIKNTKIIYNGIKELRELYDKGIVAKLNLKFFKNIFATYIDDNNEACIMLVNIKDYYRFITDENETLRSYLFESNIRDYQNNTNDVNKEIIKTLNQPNNIDFWWLNNGVTILVDEMEIKPNSLNLVSPRIVNGLQTSYCIYETIFNTPPLFRNGDEKRNVLVKVIKTNNEKTTEDIILATNNQTPINTSDLIANNIIQKNIEEMFKSKGYYYERRNNYYSRKRDIPKNKIIEKTQLLQYCISVLQCSPSVGRNNPKTLMYKGYYNDLINERTDPEVYLNICVIAERINELIDLTPRDDDVLYQKYGTAIISFKLHLLLINIILIFKNTKFNVNDLKKITKFDVNEKIFNRSIEILNEILEKCETSNKLYYAKNKQIDEDIMNFNYIFE